MKVEEGLEIVAHYDWLGPNQLKIFRGVYAEVIRQVFSELEIRYSAETRKFGIHYDLECLVTFSPDDVEARGFDVDEGWEVGPVIPLREALDLSR